MFSIFLERVRKALMVSYPVCLGSIPIGIAFGVLLGRLGVNPLIAFMMSLLVNAGGAQFMAVSMIVAGAGFWSIITATFILNLRHFLYSSGISPHLKNKNTKFLLFFASGLIDESFALNSNMYHDKKWTDYDSLYLNELLRISWVGSTLLGALFGEFITIDGEILGYVMTIVFIGLLIFQLRNYVYLIATIVAGISGIILYLVLQNSIFIVFSTLIGTFTGYFMIKLKTKKEMKKIEEIQIANE